MTNREITAIGGAIVALALIASALVYESGKMWGWW